MRTIYLMTLRMKVIAQLTNGLIKTLYLQRYSYRTPNQSIQYSEQYIDLNVHPTKLTIQTIQTQVLTWHKYD